MILSGERRSVGSCGGGPASKGQGLLEPEEFQNWRVTKIVQRGNRVIITVDNISTFVAVATIITVPLGFQNGNSAISDLGVGIGNKIALRFSTIFWPNVKVFGLAAQASYACGYFLNIHKATGHPVLVYTVAGRFCL